MARLSFLPTLFPWLRARTAPGRIPSPGPAPIQASVAQTPAPASAVIKPDMQIAWGARVSGAFKRKAINIARRLCMDPGHLMAIMAFETSRTFDPSIINRAGSGATGLIQFMPSTAKALGTTTARLAAMSAVEQLDYVEKYLSPHAGKMGDLASAYMAVLYPRAVGKEPGYVLFRKGSVAYKLNRGLDVDGNGFVTKTEAAAKVQTLLEEGLRPGLIG